MKTILVFFAAAALAFSAQAAASDTPNAAPKSGPKAKKASGLEAGAPAATPAAKTIQPLTIPKDATPGENGTFKYTDKDGKKWTYVATPFGISRAADMGPAPAPAATAVPSKIVDLGDTVRFEQPGPFGTFRWEKKKSELTADERKLLEDQKPDQQKAEQK